MTEGRGALFGASMRRGDLSPIQGPYDASLTPDPPSLPPPTLRVVPFPLLLQTGSVIMRENEPNTIIYLVIEGSATVTVDKGDGSGQSFVCASCRRGDFFGESTVLKITENNPATVRADDPGCTCAIFDTRGAGGKALTPRLCNYLEAVAAARRVPAALSLGALEYVADIGGGGYGTVMLMRHKRDKQPIALKVMRRERIQQPKQKLHVLSEKALMIELCHPFVVDLVGAFKDSERLFLAMEFVSGGELYNFLTERSEVTMPMKCRCAVRTRARGTRARSLLRMRPSPPRPYPTHALVLTSPYTYGTHTLISPRSYTPLAPVVPPLAPPRSAGPPSSFARSASLSRR